MGCKTIKKDSERRGPGRPPASFDAELAGLAWALAHPLRVKIFRLLIERGSCICGDLVDVLPVAQSTVSQHLKILKEAGLVAGEVDGPKVCYCVDKGRLKKFKQFVSDL